MSGCDWQKKSFSVAVSESHGYLCYECNKPTDNRLKYNGDILCFECFGKKKIGSSGRIQEFLTTRDKLYDFVDVNTTGKPIYFTSKGQWKRHLKKLGLHDDIQQSPRGSKIKWKEPEKKYTAKDYAKDIMDELISKNLNDKLLRKVRRWG